MSKKSDEAVSTTIVPDNVVSYFQDLLLKTKETKSSTKAIRANCNINYSYFTIAQLSNVLTATQFINKYNIINDIVLIICNYCGVLDWSSTDKSPYLTVSNCSTSTSSSLRVLPVMKKRLDSTHMRHIGLLNEYIDCSDDNSNNNQIYRYLFKYFYNGTSSHTFQIGLMNIYDYNDIINQKLLCSNNSFIGSSKNSYGWNYYRSNRKNGDGSLSWYLHGNAGCTRAESSYLPTKWQIEQENDDNKKTRMDLNCYILLEINLKLGTMTIINNGIKNDSTYEQDHIRSVQIPKTVVNSPPFRVGVSLWVGVDVSNDLGVDLVHINLQDKE